VIKSRRRSAVAETPDLQLGQTIAGYRVERLIGSGGMGVVYEATQLSLKRRVALKVIAGGVPVDATLLGRFRREGELQAIIDHPHILPVYEAGEDQGRLFIAMRLVPGPTLKTLSAGRSLEPAETLRILGDIAGALDAAHAAGLIHRDVKPQNILLAPGGHAYLADFGLSRSRGDQTLTRAGQLLGSLNYIPPEQIRGERVDAAADIYAFTCVLYECLVGLVPFPRDSDAAVLHAHEEDPPPKPSEIRPEFPPALDEVIAHGMAKDPADRPASASALITAARPALGAEANAHATVAQGADADASEPTLVRTPPSAKPAHVQRSASVRTRLPRWIAVTAAAVALLAGIAAGYLVVREPTHAAPPPKTVTASSADGGYAKRVTEAFASLAASSAASRSNLVKGGTEKRQARLLEDIAGLYREARQAIGSAHPPTSARASNTSLEQALAGMAGAYSDLASAARRGNRSLYNKRKAAVARADARLAAATSRLAKAGYSVQ
jgi:serine/threonine-protein kinase